VQQKALIPSEAGIHCQAWRSAAWRCILSLSCKPPSRQLLSQVLNVRRAKTLVSCHDIPHDSTCTPTRNTNCFARHCTRCNGATASNGFRMFPSQACCSVMVIAPSALNNRRARAIRTKGATSGETLRRTPLPENPGLIHLIIIDNHCPIQSTISGYKYRYPGERGEKTSKAHGWSMVDSALTQKRRPRGLSGCHQFVEAFGLQKDSGSRGRPTEANRKPIASRHLLLYILESM